MRAHHLWREVPDALVLYVFAGRRVQLIRWPAWRVRLHIQFKGMAFCLPQLTYAPSLGCAFQAGLLSEQRASRRLPPLALAQTAGYAQQSAAAAVIPDLLINA
jgi:hypothetical protein